MSCSHRRLWITPSSAAGGAAGGGAQLASGVSGLKSYRVKDRAVALGTVTVTLRRDVAFILRNLTLCVSERRGTKAPSATGTMPRLVGSCNEWSLHLSKQAGNHFREQGVECSSPRWSPLNLQLLYQVFRSRVCFVKVLRCHLLGQVFVAAKTPLHKSLVGRRLHQ